MASQIASSFHRERLRGHLADNFLSRLARLLEAGLSKLGAGLLADAYPAPRRIEDATAVRGSNEARAEGERVNPR